MGAFDVSSAWISAAGQYKDAIKNVHDIGCIVEIGVDWGYSLFTLARDFPNAVVIGIDDYAHHHDAEQAHAHVVKHIGEFKNAKLLHMTSEFAHRNWRDPRNYLDIDLLHIDADHSYEGVKKDFEMWNRYVRPGGVIMLHDVNSNAASVGRFFAELEGEKVIVDLKGAGLGIYFKDA